MNTQFLKDHWSDVKTKLKQKYPNLTNNDLAYISGSENEVFGRVELRTGVNRELVEHSLQEEMSAA